MDGRSAARVRPELRQWMGKRPEAPAGNFNSPDSTSSSGAEPALPPPGPSDQPEAARKPGALGVRGLRNSQKQETQPEGSACGEARSTSQMRAPPSETSSLRHRSLRNLYAGQEATEPDTEQWTGSKLGKEYIKPVYCHSAYLAYM